MKVVLDCEKVQQLLKLTKGNVSIIAKEIIQLVSEINPKEPTGNCAILIINEGIEEVGQTVIGREVLDNIPKVGELIIENNLIKCGSRKIEFNSSDKVIESIDMGEKFITIPYEEFKKAVEVEYSLSSDETRPILKGILIDKDNFVALDSFRIAIRKHNIQTIKNELVIPGELIKFYKKLKSKEDVSVYVSNYFTTLEIGDIRISVKSLEGDYIKYKSILPEEYRTTVEIESEILVHTLKSYKDIKVVKLNFLKDKVEIEANNTKMTIKDEIECKTNGEPIEIVFNPNYLIDALKQYKGNVKIQLNNELSPVSITKDYKYDLVLPVRIRKY